jgi:serine/threonine protein kinase
LNDAKVVHGDIKPDNILIKYNKETDEIEDIKVIDFGSSFSIGAHAVKQHLSAGTPEYMPPEILQSILAKRPATGLKAPSSPTRSPTSKALAGTNGVGVDMWSLGCVILEILCGAPLWLPLKCRVLQRENSTPGPGLLAVKGRGHDKILEKQRHVIESLESILTEKCQISSWNNAQALQDLLKKMLVWNPRERITPEDLLNHPFLKS